ncbi:C6 zinc finger domain-containing protein [Apiospora arundinis]|uniref:C6 zinc finger domain-containing protein n=1 Tax=Apiospora arundinis TaxID=335852 RepID=A0ABR2I2C9_9PEZI
MMRRTLRRSCEACARSKLSCDLRTPQCSRCLKRKAACSYANEPLSSPPDGQSPESPLDSSPSRGGHDRGAAAHKAVPILSARNGTPESPISEQLIISLPTSISSLDPFDSFPKTRLPRQHVQRLIYHFLSKIAFQYYPLDLSAESNPFIVSWWPVALEDPALFHVSLQTASLDDELAAQKGFPISELLMADSLSLVRQKVGNPTSAIEDATMDSVVTLAAIEHGKGNFQVSNLHITGIIRMVKMRGGINELKLASPLTARMVAWVCLIVTGSPQFPVQDDDGCGDGLSPIPQWRPTPIEPEPLSIHAPGLEPRVRSILARLNQVVQESQIGGLSTTDLHDLTCYVIHRLLLLPSETKQYSQSSVISECLRHAMILYMFIIHGPTYFPHTAMMNGITPQLKSGLEALFAMGRKYDEVILWLVSVGLVASVDTTEHQWFRSRAAESSLVLGLYTWKDVLAQMKVVLWLDTPLGSSFRRKWEELLFNTD